MIIRAKEFVSKNEIPLIFAVVFAALGIIEMSTFPDPIPRIAAYALGLLGLFVGYFVNFQNSPLYVVFLVICGWAVGLAIAASLKTRRYMWLIWVVFFILNTLLCHYLSLNVEFD